MCLNRCKICDFGAAKWTEADGETIRSTPHVSATIYRAPEVGNEL